MSAKILLSGRVVIESQSKFVTIITGVFVMTVVYEAPPLAELITEVDCMTGESNLYNFHNDNLKGGLHPGRKSIY